MTLRLLITTGASICLLLLLTACRVAQAGPDRNRSQCQRSLRALENAVKAFPDDHGGQHPATLDEALSNIGFGDVERTARMVRCPGTASLLIGTDIRSRTGYYYVDWSKWFGPTNAVPTSYPLIYDRFLSNHEGKGINLVLVDGTILWDEG